MFISDFAIKRPIITVVTMIALVVFGLAALARLDTDEFPDIDQPIVFLGIAYPGAAPDVVEREVVTRIEDRVAGISGVDKVNSTSTDGFAQIIVQFAFSKDVNQATQDVRDAISAVRAQLPAEMLEPIVQRFDPNTLPIVSLALTSSTLTTPQLTQLADQVIAGDLRSVPGVAQVNIVGGDSAQLNIDVRPTDLAASGIGIDQVVNALRGQNLAAPVGNVTTPLEQRSIRLEGRFDRPEDFESMVVGTRNGQLIRLGEVATVSAGAAEPKSAARFNGTPAIGLDIVKSREYATTAVSDGVQKRVAALSKTLPPGVRIETIRDAGVRVRNSVHNVEETLIEGAVLTVLVVFLFLNSWRSTVITGLALPVSVLTSFVPLLLFGFTLNVMSLMGLSLAIGILIDDAIVVRENIVRHVELGADHLRAAHEGTDEIGLAVTATTFSIVAVFVPVGFMPGIAGQFFKPFALTIAAAVLVSLFVSFSLDPMLSAYWPDPQIEAHERRNPIARALDRFNKWFDRQAEKYERVIGWALDHRWLMIGIAGISFIGAIALQVMFGGFGFAPLSDNSELNVAVETPPGSSLEYTTLKAEEIAAMARRHPEVAYVYSTVGSSSGSGAVDAATIYVRLVPKHQRSISQEEFGQQLRAELAHVGGATAYTYAAGGFAGNQKALQLQLQGPDALQLAKLAEPIADSVRATPGAVDVGLSSRGQKPELTVSVNRGLAGALNVSLSQLAISLRYAFAGVDAGTWVDPTGVSRYVHVRLASEARRNAADLGSLPVALAPGADGSPAFVPLGQVATIAPSTGPAQIDHYQRQRVVTIGANVLGASVGNVARDVMSRVNKVQLPPGYHITQGGQVANQNEVFISMVLALGVAVMLMYLILVIQFGSFLDPMAILVSLPLSLIGVVGALLVTRDTLNIMSLIGVMMLMGIVAKNAILLIDFAKWAREDRGLSPRDALIEAGRTRLRPIMMTTLALIAGMIPVALGYGEGADFRAPLGRAVIGGVIASTVLTLLVIPTVYEVFDEWREWLFAKFRRKHAAAHPVTTLVLLGILAGAHESKAQQNPSPMVEATRAHERLTQQTLGGTTRTFIGPQAKPVDVWISDAAAKQGEADVVIHFLGASWLPEYAVSKLRGNPVAAVVNIGAGSGIYDRSFSDPAAFDTLLAQITREVSAASNKPARIRHVTLSGFSAGHGAIRAILREPRHFARVDAVLLLDGMHTSYVPEGTVLEKGGTLDPKNLDAFVRFAQAAMRGEKAFVVTHSEIFPGTFASTTETADYLLNAVGLKRKPVLVWGPRGMQQLSEARAGKFELLGFAGNSAPDHVDHLHGMPEFLAKLGR